MFPEESLTHDHVNMWTVTVCPLTCCLQQTEWTGGLRMNPCGHNAVWKNASCRFSHHASVHRSVSCSEPQTEIKHGRCVSAGRHNNNNINISDSVNPLTLIRCSDLVKLVETRRFSVIHSDSGWFVHIWLWELVYFSTKLNTLFRIKSITVVPLLKLLNLVYLQKILLYFWEMTYGATSLTFVITDLLCCCWSVIIVTSMCWLADKEFVVLLSFVMTDSLWLTWLVEQKMNQQQLQ